MENLYLVIFLLFLGSCGKEVDKVNLAEAFLIPTLMAEKTLPELSLSMLDEINRYRLDIGLSPFATRAELDFLAQEHAEDLANGAVDFSSYDESLCSQLIQNSSIVKKCSLIRAHGPAITEIIMSAWLNSEVNLAKIQNPDFNLAGVGVMKDSDDKYFWVVYQVQIN